MILRLTGTISYNIGLFGNIKQFDSGGGSIKLSEYFFGQNESGYSLTVDESEIVVINGFYFDDILYSIQNHLTFDGTFYIDTEFTPTNNSLINIEFKRSESTNKFLFGSRTNNTTNDGFALQYGTTTSYPIFGSEQTSITSTISENQKHKVELSQDGYFLDGEKLKEYDEMSFSSNLNLFIGSLNQNGTVSGRTFDGDIYSVRIFENGKIVRYMLPCCKGVDDTIGMFDFVNKKFYPVIYGVSSDVSEDDDEII